MPAADLHCTRTPSGVLIAEIRRPAVHNALDSRTEEALGASLAQAVADSDVRVLVLTGAGGAAFCAGWDLSEMQNLTLDQNAALADRRREFLWTWYTAELPTVVALTGICYGAGALLAACADLRIGGPGTRFAVTGMTYGYANLAWRLPDLVGVARATEILLAGRSLDGAALERCGLLSEFVADENVVPAAIAAAERVAALPPRGVLDAKRLLRPADARARFEAEWVRERAAFADVPPAGLLDR